MSGSHRSDSDLTSPQSRRSSNELPSDLVGSPAEEGSTNEATRPHNAAASADDSPTIISSGLPSLIAHRGANSFELGRILEGERLGHFQLTEFVGGGGMGAVFRAADTMLGRTVAVKVLAQNQASDDDMQLRFKNEAQSAARLDHPNIARVYYVGEDRGVHYIVFEYIEGVNVRDLVDRSGPLSVADAVRFTLQVAEALGHASQRDVVHRDIKPSNILIASGGVAKLVDMGLARLHQVEHSGDDLTASGVTLGTFDYISPEQARNPRAADVRSDLYSLGCTFYFMLTGRPPFPDGTVLQKLLRHQGDEPTDPRTYRTDLPDRVVQVINRLMAKTPDDRFQEPNELVGELLVLAREQGLDEIASGAKVWSSPRPIRRRAFERHLPWLAPIAALLVIVVVLHNLWTPAEAVIGFTAPNGPPIPVVEVSTAAPIAPPVIEKPPAPGPALPADTDKTSPASPKDGDPPAPTGGDSPPKKSVEPSPAKVDEGAAEIADDEGPANSLRRRIDRPDTDAGLTAGDNSLAEVSTASVAAAVSLAGDQEGGELSIATGPSLPRSETLVVAATTRIVDGSGDVAGRYASLGAALAESSKGDIIELQFDGRQIIRVPLTVRSSVTVRAARGSRPVLSFVPDEKKFGTMRAMITITDGRFSLEQVHLEMDLPRSAATEGWTLVGTWGATSLQIADSTMTIRNATVAGATLHRDTAFLRIVREPIRSESMDSAKAMAAKPFPIKLVRCIVRGEADLVRSDGQQPFLLTWNAGLLAVSERLLVMESSGNKSAPDANIRIAFSDVTAHVRRGLLLAVSDKSQPYQLPAKFDLTNCILLGDRTGDPSLVVQVGAQSDPTDYEARIAWAGRRNFYQNFNFDAFWVIRDEEAGGELIKRSSFGDWRTAWKDHETSPVRSLVLWKGLPESQRAFHDHTTADYALDRSEPSNPALGRGKDPDAGVLAAKMPALPPASSSILPAKTLPPKVPAKVPPLAPSPETSLPETAPE